MVRLERGKFLGVNNPLFQSAEFLVSDTVYVSPVGEDWHYHESNHLTLIVNGGNNEYRTKNCIEAAPGKVLLYEAGLPHRNTDTVYPSRNINIDIGQSFLDKYDLTMEPDNYAALSLAVLRIYKESCTSDSNTDNAIQSLLMANLRHKEVDRANGRSWVSVIRDYIHDKWNEPFSLEELAREVGLHPVSVSKFFSKTMGCSLGEYSRAVKIHKSLSLIRGGEMSLTQVALECGFFDQSHFIRAFKHTTGLNPGEWKRMQG